MGSSLLSPQFVIGMIRIGSIEGASCFNMGNNYPSAFENHQKLTQGFGTIEGDSNHIDGTKSLLHDSDFIDMMNLPGTEVPDWLQRLILESAGQTGISKD